MTTWDVTLLTPIQSQATWDVTLKTSDWTYYNISGTSIASSSGYSLLDSSQTGYTLRASSPLPKTLATSNQSGYSLQTGNDQTGYTLEE